jgi:hypothetical protein
MGEHAAVLCFALLYQMKKSDACKKKNVCTLPMVKGEVWYHGELQRWRTEEERATSPLCAADATHHQQQMHG